MWKPSEEDKAWQRDFVEIVGEGAIWGTAFGVFRIDKETKTVILTARPPWIEADNQDLMRVRLTFEAIGWSFAELEE